MADTMQDPRMPWLRAITRMKSLSGQTVVVSVRERQDQSGFVIYESRNGILFAPDRDDYEAIFIPWTSIIEISVDIVQNIP